MILKMLGLSAGIGAALVYAGYNTMAPRSQLYGQTFIGAGPSRRELALTFDDGPNDPSTIQLLAVLAKHAVKATFFLIGQYVDQRPDIVREIASQGHVIANHTYTHPNLIFCSQKTVREEIAQCEHALTNAVGNQHVSLFRPPWGARTPAVLRTVKSLGFTPILWSVAGRDWSAKSADEIERKIRSGVRGGDVILLHDGGHLRFGIDRGFTVQATDHLLTRYRDEGYAFKTIPEMMLAASSNRPS